MITAAAQDKDLAEMDDWTARELIDYLTGPDGEPARRAIAEGVERDDTVADLELLGLSLRTINLLEESHLTICTVKELVSKSPEELLKIKSFASTALREVMYCLACYDRLPGKFDQMAKYEAKLRSRVRGERIPV